MTEYTLRNDWVCFEYTTTNGKTVYIEQKLKTTIEDAIEKGKEIAEMTSDVR